MDDDVNQEKLETLLDDLSKPIFVWRMARHDRRPGALPRRRAARHRAHQLIMRYALEVEHERVERTRYRL